MKQFATALAALAVVPAVLASQEVGPRKAMGEQLAKNLEDVTEVMSHLSLEQWNFKSSPDRWSVAEVLEHITASEEWVLTVIRDSLSEKEISAEQREQGAQVRDGFAATLADRTQTFDSPEPFVPNGRYGDAEATLESFAATRQAMLQMLESTHYELGTRFAMHPFLGDADAETWYVAAIGHGNRHLEQIREVMHHPDFPGGTDN